ncbi:NACHT domain-containing protein [Streptomyces sp. NPDC003832]
MDGGNRERQRLTALSWVSAVMVGASLVWAFVSLDTGTAATDVTALLGFPLAVVSLVVSVCSLVASVKALHNPANAFPNAQAASEKLAKEVRVTERRQLDVLVGRVNDRRLNLHYSLRATPNPAAATPVQGRQYADEGPGASVPDIATFYRGVSSGRLIIVGPPGAGKTVLAIELALEMLKTRTGGAPVPVRVPLAEWDLRTTPKFEDFLITRLVSALGWSRALVTDLVSFRLVLPVLDGLDEMDPPLRHNGSTVRDADGHPLPDPNAPRARGALEQLNDYTDRSGKDPGQLVLTCREAHYEALPEEGRLQAGTLVRIDGVETDQAVAYLTKRSNLAADWRDILESLAHGPSELAQALSTPWRLSLVATTYRDRGNPRDLLTLPSPEAVEEYLLARCIPAATASTTRAHHRYEPAKVHRWLHHTATSLLASRSVGLAGEHSESGTDLALHRMWPLAGRTRVPLADGALTFLIFVALWSPAIVLAQEPGPLSITVVALAGLLGVANTVADIREPQPFRVPTRREHISLRPFEGFMAAYESVRYRDALEKARKYVPGVALVYTLFSCAVHVFRVADFPARTPAVLRLDILGRDDNPVSRAISTLVLTPLISAVVGFLVVGFVFFLAALPTALARGATAALTDPATHALTPGAEIRDDLKSALGVAALIATTVGAGTAAVSGPQTAFGLGWLAFTVTLLSLGPNAGRRYLAFKLCSVSRRRVPLRLRPFLDWACDAGLLRPSGIAYQFRHQELQRWLAATPMPPEVAADTPSRT